jgi:hypothetical protein
MAVASSPNARQRGSSSAGPKKGLFLLQPLLAKARTNSCNVVGLDHTEKVAVDCVVDEDVLRSKFDVGEDDSMAIDVFMVFVALVQEGVFFDPVKVVAEESDITFKSTRARSC